jgi:hypothetical protein
VVGRRERPHDLRCDNGAGVVVGGGIGERPLQGRGTSVVADPGRCPGLGEAALQAACLSRLITARDQHLPCGGTPATDPPGRVPAHEQPNLEYGASAVFPCGGTPATDPQGRAPALGRGPNYASRVFLKINRRERRGLPEDIASRRERGRSDRPLALTAWEDGGRAVLQVDAAHRGGLPHLDDSRTTLRASFSKSIEGDNVGSLRTSHQCGSVAVPIDRWL